MKRFLFMALMTLICLFAGCKNDIPIDNPADSATITEYAETITQQYGDNSDFGIAYGIAELICEKRKLLEFEADYCDVASMNADNVWLLDLSRPEFDSSFLGNEYVKVAESLSLQFCKYVYDTYGWNKLETLLQSTPDDAEKVAIKKEWLEKEGCTVMYEPVAAYSFVINDNEYKDDYPYYVSEDGYNMFFSLKDINEAGFKAYFEGYRPIHNLAADDFKEAGALFWRDNKRTDSVADIYTDFLKEEELKGAEYFLDVDRIVLYHNWEMALGALVHEYVHFLDADNILFTSNAVLESYTEEFAVYEYSGKMRQCSYINENVDFMALEKLGIYDREKEYYDIALLNDYNATLFYMGEVELWCSVDYYKTIRNDGREYYAYLELPYYAASSFYKFLMEKYGEERVHEASGINHEFSALWGDDYPSLYKEWGEGLLEKYEEKLLSVKGQ